jgi:hypothetical protein
MKMSEHRLFIREEQRLEMCDDCPHCDAWSVDCEAFAWCNKANQALPANGQDGLKIMGMEIPEWCPLPKADDLPRIVAEYLNQIPPRHRVAIWNRIDEAYCEECGLEPLGCNCKHFKL